MVKNICELFEKCWELHQRLEKDGGRDNSLKERYYDLLNKLIGLRAIGIHSGYEYEIIGITKSEIEKLPGLLVRRIKDGHIGFVLCENLLPLEEA